MRVRVRVRVGVSVRVRLPLDYLVRVTTECSSHGQRAVVIVTNCTHFIPKCIERLPRRLLPNPECRASIVLCDNPSRAVRVRVAREPPKIA